MQTDEHSQFTESDPGESPKTPKSRKKARREWPVIEEYLSELALAPASIYNYRRHLAHFFAWLETAGLELENVTIAAARRYLDLTGWGDAACYMASVAIRQFAKWRFGAAHPLTRFRVRRTDSGMQKTLNRGQLEHLLSIFDPETAKGKRDLALVVLMAETGLRSSEVCRLVLANIDLQAGSLTVRTKGGKMQTKVFTRETARLLKDWIAERANLADPKTPNLFVSIGGIRPGTALTDSGLRVIFRYFGRRAGLGKLSPHVMRRTFATLAIQAGAPTRLVQKQGGWASLSLVERYTRALNPEDFAPFSPIAGLNLNGQANGQAGGGQPRPDDWEADLFESLAELTGEDIYGTSEAWTVNLCEHRPGPSRPACSGFEARFSVTPAYTWKGAPAGA